MDELILILNLKHRIRELRQAAELTELCVEELRSLGKDVAAQRIMMGLGFIAQGTLSLDLLRDELEEGDKVERLGASDPE